MSLFYCAILQSPEEVGSLGLWDVVSSNFTKCFHPFELDPRKVPIMQKRYTAIFDRNKEYLYVTQNEAIFIVVEKSVVVIIVIIKLVLN